MLPLLASVSLPFLDEIVVLFFLSALIAYLCHRVGLVPIAGFLLTGVMIGPSALGLVHDLELVDMMAEVGVILLLFTIGLEFSLKKLARIRRAIFVGGGLQVGITCALVAGGLAAFGVAWPASIYTGCLVALSSTAIVLGLLSDRAETDTPTGRLALAILIFQDLAIILMVLLVAAIGGEEGTSPLGIAAALGKALAVIGLVVVLARNLVPRMLAYVAQTRRQEIFVLAVVAICFGTAWLTSLAGVSLALGAFLAGLVVSESQYSEHALSEILPFRSVFNAVFFVSVGMLLDLTFVLEHPFLLLGTAAAILLIKVLVTAGSALALGFPMRIAAATALALAQIGEFSFVLERAGRAAGLSPAGLGPLGEQTFIAATVLLMLITPLQVAGAPRFGAFFEGLVPRDFKARPEPAHRSSEEDQVALEDHVIVVGYGPAGRRLAHVLEQTGIPFVVVEMNPEAVEEARAKNRRALYGDASRTHLLEAAGLDRAKLCVVVINDQAATQRIVRVAHHYNPTLQIIVRTRFLSDVEPLRKAGADIVVPEEMETSVRIFSHVLGAYMVPSQEIEQQVKTIRAHDYGIFRGSIQEAHLMVLEGLDEEGLHTRAVAVRNGAPVEGKTLGELGLRREHGLTVLAVRRKETTVASPAGDFRLQAGDRLVLVGSADQFATCADLFRVPSLSEVQEEEQGVA